VAFHWTDLHRSLRARMPASDYHAGVTVAAVAQADPGHAAVRVDDGSEHPFDLVVCADGYRSHIANHPDLAHMSSAEAAEWWASVVQHPPWFTFEA
jgi:2-polyprenyl-6-methoxyphenol hydroxylase-like FAD-dependent oxidoreductase